MYIGNPHNKSKPFITVWKTDNPGTSGSNEVRLPLLLVSTLLNKTIVDWGDGNRTTLPVGTLHTSPDLTHTYATAGVYEIKIYGIVNQWQFNNGGDRRKILEIKQLGGFQQNNKDGAFYGCSNLNAPNVSDILNLSTCTNFKYGFQGNSALNYIKNVENWDVSTITTGGLDRLFHTSNFNQNINSWRFPLATSLEGFFNGNASYNQPMNEWEVQNITDMRYMFNSATAFVQDISMWTFNINVLLSNFMTSKSNYPPAYYDALLINWAARFIGSGRTAAKTLGMGTNKYTSAGASARAALVSDGWTITDGGLI